MATKYLRDFWRTFWPFAAFAVVLLIASLVWAILTDLRFAWGLVSAIVAMSVGGWLGWRIRSDWQFSIEIREGARVRSSVDQVRSVVDAGIGVISDAEFPRAEGVARVPTERVNNLASALAGFAATPWGAAMVKELGVDNSPSPEELN